MKKFIILIMLLIITGCSIHNRENEFSREEIEEYGKENYPIGDIEFIEDYYDDNKEEVVNWKYHYFKFKEDNERSLEFTIVDKKRFDSKLTSSFYYSTDTNYYDKVIEEYVNSKGLPDNFYLSNEEGAYSTSDMEAFGKPYKIVIPYSSDSDFKNKLDVINDYVNELNEYNKDLTGTNNNLYIRLLFVNGNESLDVRIFDKDRIEDSTCSYKNMNKCILKLYK